MIATTPISHLSDCHMVTRGASRVPGATLYTSATWVVASGETVSRWTMTDNTGAGEWQKLRQGGQFQRLSWH